MGERIPFFKFGDSFSEKLRCDLIFNLHPGEKQEVLWVVEKRCVDYTVVNVVSDIPTFPQSLNEAMPIPNHLCPFDKLPLFVNKSVNRMNVVIINDSVRPITDKEMKKFAEKFAFFTVIEKVAVLLLKTNVEVFLLYGGKSCKKNIRIISRTKVFSHRI